MDWSGSPQGWKEEVESVKTREGEQEIRKELDAGAGKREDQTQDLSPRCSREQEKQEGHWDHEDFPYLPSSCEVSMTSLPTAMRKRQDTHSATLRATLRH